MPEDEAEERQEEESLVVEWVEDLPIKGGNAMDEIPNQQLINFVLECVKEWVRVRAMETKDAPTMEEWSQFRADMDHSSLLRRLLSGKKALPEPPPLRHSYPDYNSVEGERPDHPWRPYLTKHSEEDKDRLGFMQLTSDPVLEELCAECQPGHRWQKDKEIHPRCGRCGQHGHLWCSKDNAV